MTKKPRKIWLTRDRGGPGGKADYGLWFLKPPLGKRKPGLWGEANDMGSIAIFCASEFHRLTALRLRKGQIVECRLTSRESNLLIVMAARPEDG